MYGQVVNVTRPSSDIQAFVFKWDIYIVPDLMRLRIDVFLFYDIRYYFFGILIYTRGIMQETLTLTTVQNNYQK